LLCLTIRFYLTKRKQAIFSCGMGKCNETTNVRSSESG
jgi:hypothetical protein